MPALWPLLFLFAADASDLVIKVSLERLENNRWSTVSPKLVLSGGDRIRLRFSSATPGNLYVWNVDSAGHSERLLKDAIERHQTYFIPPGEAHFTIDGPPGFDVVHFILTPSPLTDSQQQSTDDQLRAAKPGTLIPRCRDSLLRARGLCTDDRAGASAGSKLGDLRPRQLRIEQNGDETRIRPSGSAADPIVYLFRVAHK
jgi:hypothetical protein